MIPIPMIPAKAAARTDAALLFSPSQPRNAKISAETAGMSGNCCIFAPSKLINKTQKVPFV